MQVRQDTVPAARLIAEAKPRIRVMLVERHTIVRECLKTLIEIESDLSVVGGFGSLEESLNGIRDLQPDVVLTDLSLPGRAGIELLAEFHRFSPLTRILVLTAHNDKQSVCAAVGAGAHGYVLNNSTADELMRAIRAVSQGLCFLCKAIEGKILSDYLSGHWPSSPAVVTKRITEREREVLTSVAAGHCNKVIARELGMSPKTVGKHRSNLMRKLRLHNVAEVTTFAIRYGIAVNGAHGRAGAPQLHCRRAGDRQFIGHLEALSGVDANPSRPMSG